MEGHDLKEKAKFPFANPPTYNYDTISKQKCLVKMTKPFHIKVELRGIEPLTS